MWSPAPIGADRCIRGYVSPLQVAIITTSTNDQARNIVGFVRMQIREKGILE